jgi:glutathione-regulated potassium-efflux system ancillary protein KefF
MICVLFAHPYPDRSRANRALLDAVQDLRGLELRKLYDLYPDFDVDVEAEQDALVRARIVVFQHPLYWYAVPGLLKHWFDKVLARGFAYGPGRRALAGKRCLWVTTTGGESESYADGAVHARPFAHYAPAVEQTARFCGMAWRPPLVVHGAHRISERELANYAADYRARLEALLREPDEAP